MSELTAKQKLIAIIAGGILLFVVVLFLIIKPLINDLSRLHEEVQQRKDTLNRLVIEERSYISARDDLVRIQSRTQEIEDLFPPKEELVRFIEQLESIADTFGSDFSITITDAEEDFNSTRKTEEKKEYTVVPGLKKIEVIPYNFRLSGDFSSIVKFLQALENQPFFSEIEALALSSEVKKSQEIGGVVRTGRVQASVRAAFYARQAAE